MPNPCYRPDYTCCQTIKAPPVGGPWLWVLLLTAAILCELESPKSSGCEATILAQLTSVGYHEMIFHPAWVDSIWPA